MLQLPQSAQNVGDVIHIIYCESTGDPNAINLTDSNAKAGHPSRGLIQVIPSTFEAHRSPLLPDNIVDPAANIYAGLSYSLGRYGPLSQNPQVKYGCGHGY
jgi:SLT domain-containing protein